MSLFSQEPPTPFKRLADLVPRDVVPVPSDFSAMLKEFAAPPRAVLGALSTMPRIPSPAEAAFQTLVEQIKEFEGELDDQHEAVIWMVSFGQRLVMSVDRILLRGPALIVFCGRTEDGPMQIV